MSLLPSSSAFAYGALYAFVLYGARFLFFALLAFWLADPSRAHRIGRPHGGRPATFRAGPNVRRELSHSLVSLAMFALINALLFGYGLISRSQMYFRFADYPAWWFWASIPVMVLLHDTFFYWLHRAMHTRLLFSAMHLLHHRSVYPTAFAAYSFTWSEAVGEALIVTAIIFIIPVHPLAFLIFQTISTAYNVYGHCGAELYPRGMQDHWLGKWLNTSSLHEHHHRTAHGNYSFYFTFWDHAMGTLEAPSFRSARSVLAPAR